MTLKEELEILRGEPIQVFTGDPLTIPCIETSDPEKLCKNPVVSVHMITYNHEPYIRQAIEGVMMQRTDFEFELVIGEDASTDKTREICFEYQKKYPDKIRVLWWHENLYRNPHPAGGNGKRTTAHCRGEFIAFCEGDDYWIDPLKLQKQVDIMRKYPNVGIVFTGANILQESSKSFSSLKISRYGLVNREELLEKVLANFWFGVVVCSILLRKSTLVDNYARLFSENFRLRIGDTQVILSVLLTENAFFMPDCTAVYRRNSSSLTGSRISNFWVGLDGLLVRYYFARKVRDKVLRRKILCWMFDYVVTEGMGIVPTRRWVVAFVCSSKKYQISCSFVRRVLKKLYSNIKI